MEWEVFLEAHYRPNLVEVQLVGIDSGVAISILGGWLDGRAGNFALRQRGQKILVAFERDVDAERFASLVRARPGERSAEWTSRRMARLDSAGRRRIASMSRQLRRRSAQ